MNLIKKGATVTISIHIIFSLIYTVPLFAESKSEMVTRLRGETCNKDLNRTTVYLKQFQRIQTQVNQLSNQAQALGEVSLAGPTQSADNALAAISAALAGHNHSKQTICQQMNPDSESTTGNLPDGYQGLSKSDRIGKLKTDYCADFQQNGASILKAIPPLKTAMEKLFNTQPVDESLVSSIQQLEDLWAQTRPIVDDLNDEQMMTKKLCEG
ncbi:MAG: hypothetical protein CSA50_09475, partial [Gammaproteobacteria bacterium]